MSTIAIALPIPPEKLDAWRAYISEMSELRREEFNASRQSKGVTSTKVWLHQGPGGPTELVVMEIEEPALYFAELGRSQDPFDVWFRKNVAELFGADLAQPLPGPVPDGLPELLLDWSAQAQD